MKYSSDLVITEHMRIVPSSEVDILIKRYLALSQFVIIIIVKVFTMMNKVFPQVSTVIESIHIYIIDKVVTVTNGLYTYHHITCTQSM